MDDERQINTVRRSVPLILHTISVPKIIICLVQIIFILIAFLAIQVICQYQNQTWNAYLSLCRIGLLFALISIILYFILSNKFISPMMLVILSFITFQFGIPILYAIDPFYSNWYISFIQMKYLILGTAFTILCIQIFVLGALLCYNDSIANKTFTHALFLRDSQSMIHASLFGFILTGLIAIPRAILFLRTSLLSGIGTARSLYSANTFVNLVRGLFVPFGFLLLTYMPRGKKRTFITIILFTYAFSAALAGDRTEGLTLLLCLLYYIFRTISLTSSKQSLFRFVLVLVGGIILLWLSAFIAEARIGSYAKSLSLGDGLASAIGEMGFNSLTIGFQMQVIKSFSYGLSYLASFIALIPTSLDLAHLKFFINPLIAINNYNSVMSHSFNWATFGLGYSLIAESYANFGFFGCLVIGLIGGIVEKLLEEDSNTPFGHYISLVFLWSFLTLPRRDLSWLINAFEWDFLFILLFLWIWHSLFSIRITRKSTVLLDNNAQKGSNL